MVEGEEAEEEEYVLVVVSAGEPGLPKDEAGISGPATGAGSSIRTCCGRGCKRGGGSSGST